MIVFSCIIVEHSRSSDDAIGRGERIMKILLLSTCLWKVLSKGCPDGSCWASRWVVAKVSALGL